MLTVEATDCVGAADCPDPDFGGADVLDDAAGVAGAAPAALTVLLADPALAGLVALAEFAVLAEGAVLAEFAIAVFDLLATKGATGGMLLICMIDNLSLTSGSSRKVSAESSKS